MSHRADEPGRVPWTNWPFVKGLGIELAPRRLVHAAMLPGLPMPGRMHQRQAIPRHPQVHGQQSNRDPCSSARSPCIKSLGIARIPHSSTPCPWDEDMRRNLHTAQHRSRSMDGDGSGGLLGVSPCRSRGGINVMYYTAHVSQAIL